MCRGSSDADLQKRGCWTIRWVETLLGQSQYQPAVYVKEMDLEHRPQQTAATGTWGGKRVTRYWRKSESDAREKRWLAVELEIVFGLQDVIEETKASAKARLAFSRNVPSKPKSRSPIVSIGKIDSARSVRHRPGRPC